MSRLLCCLRARRPDMGAALSHPQEGEASDGVVPVAPPTMADVIRERKKKAGGAGLSTLRRRIANAARRPRDNRPDRGCEHARFIRSVVSTWRLAEVFLLCEELEAAAACRDLSTQACLAREPAPALHAQLRAARDHRWWCDVELCGGGGGAGSWSVWAHRCILSARSGYFRELLQRYPPSVVRVPLEGPCAGITLAECEACVTALYTGTTPRHRAHSHKYEDNTEVELDITNIDTNSRNNTCTCNNTVSPRLVAALAITRDPLHTSMHYLLDSGEMADTRLVFRLENGCGAAYGFRSALELPCHRVVLAARSRFFKCVMSRRSASASSGGAVCVDEKVLPRRYARALLHAAYTDQVDLSLIGRNTSSPPTTNNGTTSAWSGTGRHCAGAARPTTTAMLDDAFQLYEIARFLEMPIVVQGCEDAIVEALTPATLAHVLRWSAAQHASQWVHRQAMRYLRDDFTVIMSHAASSRIPRAALSQALASDHLQASEQQILRALLKWSADQPPREPNLLWHTSGGGAAGARRGARRRSLCDAALRSSLSALLPLVRTEHLPHDADLLHQLVRRGIIPSPPPPPAESSTADAWLGRGSYRPARCFLPYLDEIKALLEEQAVPEAEVARARRARYLHRIPDTLYMVAAARNPEAVVPPSPPGGGAGAWLPPRTAQALRARARELRALPAAKHAHDHQTQRQIALRAVREMGLPDACADVLMHDDLQDNDSEQNTSDWEGCAGAAWGAGGEDACCRRLRSSGSVGCAAASSARAAPSLRIPLDASSRASGAVRSAGVGAGGAGGGACSERDVLCAAVPDVAMAPNANTHLLTHAAYCAHPSREYGGGGAGAGVVLQLDLGDGATHTPRPGSRAQRNSTAAGQTTRNSRDHTQAMSCLRARTDEDELRAAIELSVMRAYSSFGGRVSCSPPPPPPGGALPPRGTAATLPHQHHRRATLPQPQPGASGSVTRHADLPQPTAPTAPLIPALPARGRAGGGSASPSPRRRHEYSLHRAHHDYRLEARYGGGSASTSRGHSPNNYA